MSATCIPSPVPPWHRPVQSALPQTIVGDDTINLNVDTTYLNQATPKAGDLPYDVVLPNGNCRREFHRIHVVADKVDSTAEFVVTGRFMGFTSLKFTRIAWSAILEWVEGVNNEAGRWSLVGGNAEVLP